MPKQVGGEMAEQTAGHDSLVEKKQVDLEGNGCGFQKKASCWRCELRKDIRHSISLSPETDR